MSSVTSPIFRRDEAFSKGYVAIFRRPGFLWRRKIGVAILDPLPARPAIVSALIEVSPFHQKGSIYIFLLFRNINLVKH